MFKKKVVLRADGSSEIGLGHIYRCIALAEMLENTFNCEFLMSARNQCENIIPNKFSKRIIPLGTDISAEAEWIRKNYNTRELVIIIDGYQFDSLYQQQLKAENIKIVYIDDLHAQHMYADVVINHTPGINSTLYSKENYTQLLLGLDYALLRKSFLNQAVSETVKSNSLKSALIALGGGDEHNITLKALNALLEVQSIEEINIVVGAAYKHQTSIEEKIIKSKKKITLFSNLGEENMVHLMQKSDLAVCTCSTTCLELIAINKPVFSGFTADNQKHLYEYLKTHQIFFDLKDLLSATVSEIVAVIQRGISSTEVINEMLAKQKQLIDGKSGDRIANAIKNLA
jgi:UDP-2,4-diacetamido-2,4,6-trideoxy-beta-L-altropyranose hydrolase